MANDCRYLQGENIKPTTTAQALALIGKRVQYLRNSDIYRSGRGYFFPRYGTIAAVRRKEIAIDEPLNFTVDMSSLVEMVLVEESVEEASE